MEVRKKRKNEVGIKFWFCFVCLLIVPGSLAAQFRWGISSFSSQQIALSRHRKSSIKLHSLKFLREIEMKMIRLLWQEDPKGLTRTAIVRFLRHEPRIFYWNLPGRQKSSL